MFGICFRKSRPVVSGRKGGKLAIAHQRDYASPVVKATFAGNRHSAVDIPAMNRWAGAITALRGEILGSRRGVVD